jgi:C4-dicarboxylate transporter DctM subunit
LFTVFGIFLAIGVPVAFGIGLSSLAVIWITGDVPLSLVVSKIFAGMDSFPLMAIPFFILTGELSNVSGMTQRIIRLADVLVGHRLRAGLAHVNIVASMIFAGVSGSVVADSAAMGSILIPAMSKSGYHKDYSVAVTATSSTIGALIPPSILMVLYGFLARVSIGKLFLGGALPGLLVGLSLMLVAHIIAVRRGYKVDPAKNGEDSLRNIMQALKDSFMALMIPFIIIGGIVGGVFTATEAGVIAVVYVLFIGLIVYRTINFKKLEKAFINAAVTTTIVMLILGVTAIFGNLLARARFQSLLIDTLTHISVDPNVQLLSIMGFLFVLGFFVDVTAVLIMFTPSLALVGQQLGFDPIHFGVVIVMITLIGATTPPVGTLLFLGCGIAGIPLTSVFKIIWPFTLALVTINLVIAFFPQLVLFLPNLLFG